MNGLDVFRCDYCGQVDSREAAVIYWTPADELDDGRRMWTPAVYCSAYCGRTATSSCGSGRG